METKTKTEARERRGNTQEKQRNTGHTKGKQGHINGNATENQRARKGNAKNECVHLEAVLRSQWGHAGVTFGSDVGHLWV